MSPSECDVFCSDPQRSSPLLRVNVAVRPVRQAVAAAATKAR